MQVDRFVVIDLEATSREASEAHIVEWAAVVLEPEWFGTGGLTRPTGGLVKPPISIPPETSAVHHIIDSDVATAPTWEVERHRLGALLMVPNTVAVAHNAQYERTALAKSELPDVPWLCTYKAALRVWPDAPSHSNEALRYWLGFGTGRNVPQAPHSAAHDAAVTAQLLRELLARAKADDMIEWTDLPALLPRCPIGDYRGMPWADVEYSFLNWIIHKARDMREDIMFCARTEVNRREEAARQAIAERKAMATVAPDESDDDLPF